MALAPPTRMSGGKGCGFKTIGHVTYQLKKARHIGSWGREFQWAMTNLKSKRFHFTVIKLAWSAHIYHIWIERNTRIYGGKCHSEESLFRYLC